MNAMMEARKIEATSPTNSKSDGPAPYCGHTVNGTGLDPLADHKGPDRLRESHRFNCGVIGHLSGECPDKANKKSNLSSN